MAILERDIMGGLGKGLLVIETFTATRPRQSISEVAEASGLDRATARRCLLTLAHMGYADYDGKYFTLTPRVLRLGTACLATMPLPQLVQPLLDKLSEELGESSSVSILDGPEIVYVARAAQRKVMSIALMPGSRLPSFCTSMGRVMLAALPEEEARDILEAAPLMPRTPFSMTDVDAVMAELGRVRASGFATIDQEVELGLRSIAVPLYNARGTIVAALNLGVAAGQLALDELAPKFLGPLRQVQAEVRAMLR
ncbi:IclR family transcriptional regulator C-terminal domain-containing protein [Devosia sp. SD17-2]|uniref:IclR family transcriptional regulator domain-containing protein n=1 Tax=Devosia sp. SD17-2 TaxID=2976459 RepID=UPI0023D7C77D|nr:IclR family transcriptional regulator C-terminal domain-containing protein [Devosia sp. SD17-2]WEJ34003.1 helix-turn-helix domain-containing protein [Devosia sp. SD17-2]